MTVAKEANKLRQALERVLRFSGPSANVDFFISSLTEHNPYYSTEEIIHWLANMNSREYLHVETIPLG